MGEPEAWETATLSFISWLDEENTNVPKILTSNVEEIERNCRNVLEVTKDNVSSIYKKRIRKDGVILSDIKSQIENTCSEDEISNNNLKYQKIISQILDHKKKLFDLEKEIALLQLHNSVNDCNSRSAAHRKAIKYYESFFNMKMTLRASKADQIVMCIVFENIEQHQITIIFDQNYNVKSFEINSLQADEYKKLTDWFNSTTPNPTNLIIKLREYVISLK